MLLPTKRLTGDKSLIAIGALVIENLYEPKTVSRLWDEIGRQFRNRPSGAISFEWFVLSLDLLFALGVAELHRGKIQRKHVL